MFSVLQFKDSQYYLLSVIMFVSCPVGVSGCGMDPQRSSLQYGEIYDFQYWARVTGNNSYFLYTKKDNSHSLALVFRIMGQNVYSTSGSTLGNKLCYTGVEPASSDFKHSLSNHSVVCSFLPSFLPASFP